MSPNMKLIVLANMNARLFSWTFTFRKVMRQQIWGQVLVLIQASSTDPFELNSEEFENRSTFAEVIEKIKVVCFLWNTVFMLHERWQLFTGSISRSVLPSPKNLGLLASIKM